jgi:transketolase
MRAALFELIMAHCERDPNALFVTGDLGYSFVEPLQAALRDRFINAGVAEQNMVTMAAALAACGYLPYVYSIAPFVTARCFEQLRNDVCYHRRTVFVVGTGAGLSYGSLGPSHHSLEDAAILSTLPGMRVLSPANRDELAELHRLALDSPGPVYFRVSREDGEAFPVPRFAGLEDGAHRLREGEDLTLAASGPAVTTALEVARRLSAEGIAAGVVSIPVLAPFPTAAVAECLTPGTPVLALFEGYAGGPLELGLRRLLMAAATPVRFAQAAAPLAFPEQVGSTEFLRHAFGIDVDGALAVARQLLEL